MNASISVLPEPTFHNPIFASTPLQDTERAASQLRATLMNLTHGSPARPWAGAAPLSNTTFGFVDIRHVAPRVRALPSPPWSAPTERFWVRPQVATRLETAAHALPARFSLGLWEGYRPLSIQNSLWQTGLELVAQMYRGLDKTQLEDVLETYIARPTPFAPHTQGRAVDVALLDDKGRVLDDRAHLQVLSSALNEAGLTNYEPEWWHWSYDAGDDWAL